MIGECDYEYDIRKWFLILDYVVLVIVLCVRIGVGYDFGIMICGFDYYIGFVDCGIWLLILDRIDGKNWEQGWEELGRFGKRWEVVEGGG